MIGKSCASTRRKRSADFDVDSVKRDMAFLIDESSSVGDENFKKFIRLTKAIVNSEFLRFSIERSARTLAG